jgi:hypothetical protein
MRNIEDLLWRGSTGMMKDKRVGIARERGKNQQPAITGTQTFSEDFANRLTRHYLYVR